jgi:glutaconate CoA-transferase subunit B
MSWNTAELMSIVLARALRDGDVMVTGTNAAITRSAGFVAEGSGKRVVTMIGAFGTVDPTAARVPASGGDQDFIPGRLEGSLAGAISDQVGGLADVICLGGLQLDRAGRLNLAVVGDHQRPTLRGPGTIGVSLMATIGRTFLYFMDHDPRTFVETVDFVGGQGLRPDGGGIDLIVTPLAVLGPVDDHSRIDLISLHPGVGFEQVQERTGFRLDPQRTEVTPEPSDAELKLLSTAPDAAALAEIDLPR